MAAATRLVQLAPYVPGAILHSHVSPAQLARLNVALASLDSVDTSGARPASASATTAAAQTNDSGEWADLLTALQLSTPATFGVLYFQSLG